MAEVDNVQPLGTATPEPTAGKEGEQTQQAPATPLFGGKTAEQFAEEFENTRKELTSLREDYSKAIHEAQYSRTILEKMAQGNTEQRQAEPGITPMTDEAFFANPGKAAYETAQRVAEASMSKWKSEFENQRKREKDEQAAYNMNQTGQSVMRANPKMYAGIEDKVKQSLADAYQSGKIGVYELGNPQFWETTAAILRVSNGEWDLQKYRNNTPAPAIPGGIEAPNGTIPPNQAMGMSEIEKAMARKYGITEEQYLAQKKADHEAMEKGILGDKS